MTYHVKKENRNSLGTSLENDIATCSNNDRDILYDIDICEDIHMKS